MFCEGPEIHQFASSSRALVFPLDIRKHPQGLWHYHDRLQGVQSLWSWKLWVQSTHTTDDAGVDLCSSTAHMGFSQIKNDPRNLVQPRPAWTLLEYADSLVGSRMALLALGDVLTAGTVLHWERHSTPPKSVIWLEKLAYSILGVPVFLRGREVCVGS